MGQTSGPKRVKRAKRREDTIVADAVVTEQRASSGCEEVDATIEVRTDPIRRRTAPEFNLPTLRDPLAQHARETKCEQNSAEENKTRGAHHEPAANRERERARVKPLGASLSCQPKKGFHDRHIDHCRTAGGRRPNKTQLRGNLRERGHKPWAHARRLNVRKAGASPFTGNDSPEGRREVGDASHTRTADARNVTEIIVAR
ncbi:hypothetical protein HPB51_024262 [Rhipicephalus microplus]|uniref:Uncharacterized protein n=1 Tax=Rhipicephalus microplus TaxID=6941 RepID=A0A9J6EJK3_RHIMP|nr:hypothetical protein HPB51_024262 [Rhipicephalus microplus]